MSYELGWFSGVGVSEAVVDEAFEVGVEGGYEGGESG